MHVSEWKNRRLNIVIHAGIMGGEEGAQHHDERDERVEATGHERPVACL
jgi:hypothetical protein